MTNEESRPKRGRPVTGRGKPMMLRLDPDLEARIEVAARQRALAPSTFARLLVKEGLDRLDQQEPSS